MQIKTKSFAKLLGDNANKNKILQWRKCTLEMVHLGFTAGSGGKRTVFHCLATFYCFLCDYSKEPTGNRNQEAERPANALLQGEPEAERPANGLLQAGLEAERPAIGLLRSNSACSLQLITSTIRTCL